MPEINIEEYLDYTIERLTKKYDETNPENMFFEDETYKKFVKEIRYLLKNKEVFKNNYCKVNHIISREHKVREEMGKRLYIKTLNNESRRY